MVLLSNICKLYIHLYKTLMKPNPTLFKYDEESGNNQSQRIKLIEYLQKRDKKGTELKFEAATVEVGVQTELELIGDQIQLQIQLVYVDKKTYLYTNNIDQIEQVQVYQSLRQMKRRKNRKISKYQKKRKPEKTKEKNNTDSPFIIIDKQNQQQKQRERRAAKIKNKQTIILNQTQLNQKKLSKQQQKVKKSHQMDTEVNLTKCICKGERKHQEYYKCEFCSNYYHYICHRRQKTNVPYQICPSCILREIESTQEIEEILCQLYLDFDKGTTFFKGQFNFKPYEYYCSQKIMNHQLELRCIQIEGNQDKMTEVMWPNECIFFLNDRKVFEVMEISKESVVRKRKDFPLRITKFVYNQEKNIDLQKVEVKLISEGSKVFQIDENFEIKQPLYFFGVYFTKNTSFQAVVNKMIKRMKTTNHKYMRNLIRNHNHEGLEVNKLTFTLLDPFSWDVIKLPVRGIHCKHAQCFDMGTYISLQLGNRSRYWKCPLCKKSTLILSQDEQQDAILQRIKNNERVPEEIVYYNSGMIEVNLYKQEESEDEQLDRKKVKKGRIKCKKSDEEQIN